MSRSGPTHREIRSAIRTRMLALFDGMDPDALHNYLADTVYLERQRFDRDPAGHTEHEQDVIEQLAHALHQDTPQQIEAAQVLVGNYAHEIHNRFSDRTYGVATKWVPGALTRLLTAADPKSLVGADFDPGHRITVDGPTDQLLALSKTHTLVLAPTHVSNLDSPLIGYALYRAGLPPFIYGAGLNLFGNPAMAFFMSRLGAYTVDRRKRHRLYKDVLKQYSTELIGRGAHSLFFPGGTRSRSGHIEQDLKRGLLGTAITAWQEGITSGREHPEVLVVPCTLTFSLVLEAETLIEDSLAIEGKSRYIITDDEFSKPGAVTHYARQVLHQDSGTYVRFGRPLDLVGNPVDDDGRSQGPDHTSFDRLRYVTNDDGEVVHDHQRDRVYTTYLSTALTRAYQRDNVVVSTHLAAFAAWQILCTRTPRLDTYHRVLLASFERWVDREALVTHLDHLHAQVESLAADGHLCSALPKGDGRPGERILQEAVKRFAHYHTRRCLSFEDWRVLVDPKLALYYGNRVAGYSLDEPETQS